MPKTQQGMHRRLHLVRKTALQALHRQDRWQENVLRRMFWQDWRPCKREAIRRYKEGKPAKNQVFRLLKGLMPLFRKRFINQPYFCRIGGF